MSNDNELSLTQVEALIESTTKRLADFDEETKEYGDALDRLERLHKIRKSLLPQEETPEVVVEKDRARLKDWLPLIATLGSTLIIVTAEAFGHTLTSKAWNERKSLR